MDDRAVGIAIRALRYRRGWRQADLAQRAGVSIERIATLETGNAGQVPVRMLREIAAALDADLSLQLRWRGEALDRLLNAAHSRLHEVFAGYVGATVGWVKEPEVSFSIYGERGVIDVLLWNPKWRALAVVELKSSLVDLQELLGTLDRKRRLADRIARERGWEPRTISAWVVVAESRTNRRRVAAHAALLRTALPVDGRAMRGWLRRPSRAVRALSFLSDPAPQRASRRFTRVERVRARVPHAGDRP